MPSIVIAMSLSQQCTPAGVAPSIRHDPRDTGPSVDRGRFASGVSKKSTTPPLVTRPSGCSVIVSGRFTPCHMPSALRVPLKYACGS